MSIQDFIPPAQDDVYMDLFVKTAAAEGVDLGKYSDEQIAAGFANFKQAAEAEVEDERKKRLLEEARKEHEEKKAYDEAYMTGVYMAQGFQDHIKEAGLPKGPPVADRTSIATKGKDLARDVASKVRGSEALSKLKGLSTPAKAGIAAGAALTAAGAGYGAYRHSKNKEASALDQVAYELAVEKAAAAGWSAEEAQELCARVVLGQDDDFAKVAEARSFEILEAAGYKIVGR